MIEVEVKAPAEADTIKRIQKLGAALMGSESHKDLYFNSPLRDFKISDEALRIRIKEGSAQLTYKGPKLDMETKSRMELTVQIDNPLEMEQILYSLGFALYATVKKCRTKYSYGDVTIALDDVKGLGSFLELEVKSAGDYSESRKNVMDLLKRLSSGESIRSSYLELLEKKSEQNVIV